MGLSQITQVLSCFPRSKRDLRFILDSASFVPSMRADRYLSLWGRCEFSRSMVRMTILAVCRAALNDRAFTFRDWIRKPKS